MKDDRIPLSSEYPIACPSPRTAGDRILLAHGEGGRLSRRLVRDVIARVLDNHWLRPLGDAAVLPEFGTETAFTADGFVVSPLFFPGGNIGSLAVHGLVNDLAVSGAVPKHLSIGFILEEGFPMETLRLVVENIREAADRCGVAVVAGDTKVVPRGAADKLFISGSGLGAIRPGVRLGADRIQPGDAVLVSGTIGDHGLAVLSAREEIDLGNRLLSDSASVVPVVSALFDARVELRFLRDPTRGGVAAVLHEAVETCGHSVEIDEASLPLSAAVRGGCEILGLDPLNVANEGKVVAFVPEGDAVRALDAMRSTPLGERAALIGKVLAEKSTNVYVRSALGVRRVLDEPFGAPLPRIC